MFLSGGFIEKDSFKRKLTCTDDVVDAIVRGQQDSNEFRELILNLPPITVHVLKFNESAIEATTTSKKMVIENIMSYYNLQNTIEATGLFF